MYFNIGPKERLEDFFNYEEEYRQIIDAVKRGERIIAIQGVRRVGKTSLMNILFNSLDGINIWADGRIIGESKDLLQILTEGVRRGGGVFGVIKSIGLSIGGLEVVGEVPFSEQDVRKVKKIHLFIDEAQYGDEKEIAKALSYLYDRFPNLTVVVSGSEVRLMETVLAFNDPSHPLFGRRIEVVTMRRLPYNKSKEFLFLGFGQLGVSVSEREVEKAVERLDGLIGWLTLYGYERAIAERGDALERVEEMALRLVGEEINNFLKNKKNKPLYISILKYAHRRSWKELLSLVRDELGRVNATSFSRALKELTLYSFLERHEGRYIHADPMVREAALRL